MRVAIVGCGGIGSRHLQSIRDLEEGVEVIAIDPSEESRTLAARRWEEQPSRGPHRLHLFETLEALSEPVDVAIIATSSDVRRSVAEKVLHLARPRHLVLEKFLFPRVEDFAAVQLAVEQANTRAWVNTTRRMWPDYARLRDGFDATGPVAMHVSGVLEHGLGSNAVHFLDLFAYLTGRRIDQLSGELLEPRPNPKRRGFIEFSGSLSGHNRLGDRFTFTSVEAPMRPLLITVTSGSGHLVIDEPAGAVLVREAQGAAGWATQPLRPVFQSSLTSRLVTELTVHGRCSLPTLDESAAVHLPLLEAFIGSYRQHTDPEADACPVT